jgi:3-phosphoshikimate 1-carboxyvinyltransferase
MLIKARGGDFLGGQLEVPGDKSISHRAAILGSIAEGQTVIRNCLMGADVLSTIGVFQALGVNARVAGTTVTIDGVGLYGLRAPTVPLDAGNAGTCMRLVSGILAGQPFTSTFIGDESLSKRPMLRVIEPLTLMGAKVSSASGGKAPLEIQGRRPLHAISYRSPVSSAQVKSCVLLAGLYADGVTGVVEPQPTRDHTERMLAAFGVPIAVNGANTEVTPAQPRAAELTVPGDISSAAFFIVAALLSKDAELTVSNVGLNPLRTGCIEILRSMGGDILVFNERKVGGELVGDIRVRSSALTGVVIDPHLVPSAIDEFPIIFVAAAFARGETVISGAHELRVKESDRIATMVDGLNAIGVQAEATSDGALISGCDEADGGTAVKTGYDHRVAMAFSIASLRTRREIAIEDAESIFTSFPSFFDLAKAVGIEIEISK